MNIKQFQNVIQETDDMSILYQLSNIINNRLNELALETAKPIAAKRNQMGRAVIDQLENKKKLLREAAEAEYQKQQAEQDKDRRAAKRKGDCVGCGDGVDYPDSAAIRESVRQRVEREFAASRAMPKRSHYVRVTEER